jgi:hypothetical protein
VIQAEAEAVLAALQKYAPLRGRRARPAVSGRRK